jgi:hypothetical protein
VTSYEQIPKDGADGSAGKAALPSEQVSQGIAPATVAAYKHIGATHGTVEVTDGHLWFFPGEYRAAENCLPGFRFQDKCLQAKLKGERTLSVHGWLENLR